MRIGDREIGPQADVYIIAELGVNHDGSVERALELTDAAADAGADAVKLQLFHTDLLMSKAAKLAAYQKAAGETDPVAMLRRLELPIREMARVVDRAHARGLHAIVTVFSVELVAEAQTLAWDAYKTASPDIIHRPLLDALAATGKPMIVSTGASTMEEVERAVGWFPAARGRLALMQCVSSYPTDFYEGGWAGIHAIKERFGLPTGYSDHIDNPEDPTRRIVSASQAVQCGARLLEKHLTDDRELVGPDHALSVTPSEFCEYARLARDTAKRFGSGRPMETKSLHGSADIHVRTDDKTVLPVERDVRSVSRQSLVTRGPLRADQRVRREDLTFKRPGTGIEPWRIDEVVGRQTQRAVEADVPLTDADLV
ncbi:MAG: N-acetylneuraminate synthase family protein [Phycisphaerales bacterium]